MRKIVFLASALLVTSPAFAQDAPVSSAAPATPQQQSAPSAAPPQSPPASENATAPVSKAEQVSAVVSSEFPSYDKDKSGALSKTEFGSWLVALRQASDASFKAGTPEADTWLGQAFAFADTDKNQNVSQTELIGFLSQGA
jgi:hypothetical protein